MYIDVEGKTALVRVGFRGFGRGIALSLVDSVARVAHLLCETVERSHVDATTNVLQNPFTQQQIADITGQTSVNVNRVFADLERQGLISRRGREIKFNDWNELRRVASFNSGYLQ